MCLFLSMKNITVQYPNTLAHPTTPQFIIIYCFSNKKILFTLKITKESSRMAYEARARVRDDTEMIPFYRFSSAVRRQSLLYTILCINRYTWHNRILSITIKIHKRFYEKLKKEIKNLKKKTLWYTQNVSMWLWMLYLYL